MYVPRGALCQSCGMPLEKDPEGGGTMADGSRSPEYCSYCYEAGGFIWADATVDAMQAFCAEKLMEMGYPGFTAKLLASDIPKLKRWRK